MRANDSFGIFGGVAARRALVQSPAVRWLSEHALRDPLKFFRRENAKVSQVDDLTRLPNRKAFIEYADAAFATSSRVDVAVLLIDIDDFASVNNAFGLAVGDKVLVEVGLIVSRIVACNCDRLTARMGDDEFAVLVRARTSDQVLAMAEEIRTAVAARQFEVHTTVSIGIGFCLPSTTVDSALRTSQNALRLAKREGNVWRSIAEGGTREVTRRPLRAPTLARNSSAAT